MQRSCKKEATPGGERASQHQLAGWVQSGLARFGEPSLPMYSTASVSWSDDVGLGI